MSASFQLRASSWMNAVNLRSVGLVVIFILGSPVSSMEVMVSHKLNALNGSTVRLGCAFTSCYKVDNNKFGMNWTYQSTYNDTEEMFMTYKHKMTALPTAQFEDRVKFSGNLEKNDVSVTISDVQTFDEGIYNCFVRNPPDRQQGHGVINLVVITEGAGNEEHFKTRVKCSHRSLVQKRSALLIGSFLCNNEQQLPECPI
ncbi:sodium channel subunit beta-2 isoform X3 [Lepisosteus oculatus]|uniref:sodium channel subunit beta-2 isoform X3 n=1 Tax=Lepisosteus oculatus TaxID=7918 RepID=UPI0007402AC5|nr:PREDICTED: sodium channel subunit beta-2 isoform X2 [Lepisosteus oculatus]